MTGGPTVSVVTAVYNGASYIGESLRSALRQTHEPVEIIVVDGGSTDGTEAAVGAVADPRVRFVAQQGRGASAARNEGIALASGDLVAFLDADDVWHPRKLEAQVAALRGSPDAGLVGSGYAILDTSLRELTRIAAADQSLRRWLLLEGNGFALTSTGLAPLAVLEEVGGFDVGLSYSGDLDLALRISQRWDVCTVDETLMGYRSHPQQLHRDAQAYERDMLVVLDRHVPSPSERRRGVANLYTRLAYYDARKGRPLATLGHLRRTLPRADRLAMLPAEALVRRSRRRRRPSVPQAWDRFGR